MSNADSRQNTANRDWSSLVTAMNAADPARTWHMEDLAGGCFGLWGTDRDGGLVWVTTVQDALPYAPADMDAEDDTLIIGAWRNPQLDDGAPDWSDTCHQQCVPRPVDLSEWPAAILPSVAFMV